MRIAVAVGVVVGVVLFVACLVGPACATSDDPDWMVRPGTIGNAVSLADGVHVYLDAVEVDKIRATESTPYFTVRECFFAQNRIVVLTPPSAQLRMGETVDVEGTLATLDNGTKALANPTVYGYTDSSGNLLYNGPLVKGLLEPTPWEWKVDLTVRQRGPALPVTSSDQPDTTPPAGATHYDSISEILGGNSGSQPQSARAQSYYSGIPDVKGLPDGSLVELECKGISATGAETIDGTTYNYFDMVENPPATDTIRCYYSQAVSATARVNRVSGQIRHTDPDTPVIDIDTGPSGYDPQILVGKVQLAEQGSIAYAWTCSDGAGVTLTSKVVTADRTDLSSNRLYVEEPGRSAGILIVYAGSEEETRGATVDVIGTVYTLTSGERWIDAGLSGVTLITPGEPVPGVLAMINRSCGGSAFNAFTLGADTPVAPGLYNVGLLVKTWGRVTGSYPSEKCFYLDDGSRLDDANSHSVLGIKVSWDWQAISLENPEVVPPTPGWCVTTTGISGMESTTTGGRARVLRVRNQADVYSLPDATPPTPDTASSPSYVATSPIAVTYSGASDIVSGLKKVELWYKKGHTGTWTYSSSYSATSSGSFSFAVSEENTYYFDLVAEDNASNRSASPTGDGDCHTIYEANLSATGRSFVHNEYLYPGGPMVRTSAHDETAAEVRQISRGYGPENELLSQEGSIEPASYTYNAAYQIKSLTDGNGHVTNYYYDNEDMTGSTDAKMGHLTKVVYPNGDTVAFPQHDPYGRVLQKVENGITINYHYDEAKENLLSLIEYPATPTLNVNYKYDDVYGRITDVWDGTDTSGATPSSYKMSYGYDDLDSVIGTTTTYTGKPAKTFGYQYYPNGSLDTLTTPAGDFVYGYDCVGNPTSLTNPSSESFSWAYADNNWLESQISPVTSTSFGYNGRGFLTDLTNSKTDQTLLSEFSGNALTMYDTVGNLLSLTANIPASPGLSGTTSYSYDSRDQLLSEESTRSPSYTNSFAYDLAGNNTTLRGTPDRQFDFANQNTEFSFDGAGNPIGYTGNPAASLGFDPENRMTSFNGGAFGAAYRGDGLRESKTVGGVTTYYLYAGSLPVCEMDSAGNIVATNTFGPTGLLSRHASSGSTFYTFDPLGNVTQSVDSTGSVVSTQAYDAYGSPLPGTASGAPFGFGGQFGYHTDPETGLQLLGHRYYDPAEARFLNRDPIGYAGGLNLYGYVGGNPVNGSDPSGFCGDGSWSSDLPIVGRPFTEAGTAYGDWESGRGSGWTALGKGGTAVGGVVIAGIAAVAGGEIVLGAGTAYDAALGAYCAVTTFFSGAGSAGAVAAGAGGTLKYFLDKAKQGKHTPGAQTYIQGRSYFLDGFKSEQLVQEAAVRNLQAGQTARVPFKDIVGMVMSKSGQQLEATNVVRITVDAKGGVHGWPILAP